MFYPIKKALFSWKLIFSLLLMVFMLSNTSYHIWAGEDREGVIDGRNLANFSGTGKIDSLKDDHIVIDDTTKRLSHHVKYYRKGGIQVRGSYFKVGTKVGYVTDSKGKIISLWLLR